MSYFLRCSDKTDTCDRYLDMQMMVLHNARERTVEDFEQLFVQADSRFKVEKVWTKGSDVLADTLIEVVYT